MTKLFFGGISLALFVWTAVSVQAPPTATYAMQDTANVMIAAR